MMKKLKTKEARAFFRAFILTLVCIFCLAGIYLGFCGAYEGVRQIGFGDSRGAVMIGENYIKFFDAELYINLPADSG